jgi:hypothetical protein
MPQQKPKPSTATQRANEALDRAAPEGKSPARKTLAFLLEGSHDQTVAPATELSQPRDSVIDSQQNQTRTAPEPVPESSQTSTKPVPNTAPDRDFNKRANSLEREALPAGVFPGSSKKIYDALYFRTRGALKPIRTIQATRRDLMQWTDIRNVKTIHDHTRRLVNAGLIGVVKLEGDHEGSIYEVFLPEELDPYQSRTSPVPSPDQKTVRDPYQKTVRDGLGNLIENKDTYASPKTSFKTNTENDDDDAALAGLIATLKNATKQLTGKEISTAESDRWKELAEVLIAELKIAAARTTISSVPAFLAEHLRRRLWKLDKKQARTEGRELPDEALNHAQTLDASSCSDCGGSGWWYPDGEAKGVAKCKHEKLTTKS